MSLFVYVDAVKCIDSDDVIYNCYEVTDYMQTYLQYTNEDLITTVLDERYGNLATTDPLFYARKNVKIELGISKFRYVQIPGTHYYELYYIKSI